MIQPLQDRRENHGNRALRRRYLAHPQQHVGGFRGRSHGYKEQNDADRYFDRDPLQSSPIPERAQRFLEKRQFVTTL